VVGIIFVLIAVILLSIMGAYLSNKYCYKPKFSGASKEYLESGEKPVDRSKWAFIEMAMIKANIMEPPKNAPKEFQIEYLEKMDEIRRVENLDDETLFKADEAATAQRFYARKHMTVEELAH
jgi:hypothetical protein